MVVISVLKESVFPPHIEVISYHRTLEEKTLEQHLFALSYVFVELEKFQKGPSELETFEDEWLYFLKSAEETKQAPDTLKDSYVKEAYSVMERFNWTELSYDAYIRASLILDGEEEALEEAKAKGEAEGEAKGEKKKTIEFAKALLQDGVSFSVVARASGLTEEALHALLDEDNL